MCRQVGLEVISVRRLRIGRVAMGKLAPGQWRYGAGRTLLTRARRPQKPLWRRVLRGVGILLAILTLLVLSGLLLGDHLTPKAKGPHSSVLPLQPAQSAIDRELVRLQAAHPDQSGVAFLSEGLDAYAARAVITRHAARSPTCSTTSGRTT